MKKITKKTAIVAILFRAFIRKRSSHQLVGKGVGSEALERVLSSNNINVAILFRAFIRKRWRKKMKKNNKNRDHVAILFRAFIRKRLAS